MMSLRLEYNNFGCNTMHTFLDLHPGFLDANPTEFKGAYFVVDLLRLGPKAGGRK